MHFSILKPCFLFVCLFVIYLFSICLFHGFLLIEVDKQQSHGMCIYLLLFIIMFIRDPLGEIDSTSASHVVREHAQWTRLTEINVEHVD